MLHRTAQFTSADEAVLVRIGDKLMHESARLPR